MKTLIRADSGVSSYLFDDSASVTLHDDRVVVDDLTISDLNAFNAALIEGVTPPSDWVGDKYRMQGGDWIDMTPEREAAQQAAQQAAELDRVRAQRAAEYPPMADYIDGIVKGDQAQVQAYIDACLAVKAKYPKPAE